MAETDPKPEVKTGDPQEEKTEKTDEKVAWDETRQEVDQYKANVEKLSEQKGELQDQVMELQSSIEAERTETAEKLETIEQKLVDKAKVEEVDDIDNLDPEYVDPKVIAVLKGLKGQCQDLRSQLSDKDKDIAALKEARQKYETEAELSAEEQRKANLKEAMLSDLDKEFGAKFRNDAVDLANKKVKETAKAPEGDYFISKFIRDCYIEVVANAPKETQKEETVSVDTGASSVTFREGEIKEGSMAEVFPQIAAKYKGKAFSMPKM